MGLLVDGVWRDDSFDKARMEGGRFNRPTTKFRNWITPDGSPGPSGEGGFPAEAGRYHLYVSLACPWAHRTIIFRHLKRLENVISMSVTSWHMGENGWTFDRRKARAATRSTARRSFRKSTCWPIRKYTGRVTRAGAVGQEAQDHRQQRIVRDHPDAQLGVRRADQRAAPTTIRRSCAARSTPSTTSSIRTSTTASIAPASPPCRRPTRRRSATCSPRSTTLERRLARQRYLAGPRMTEADWRLFTTLIRFDAVYYSHFKCNLRRIGDYPNLSNYLARPLSGAGRRRDRRASITSSGTITAASAR